MTLLLHSIRRDFGGKRLTEMENVEGRRQKAEGDPGESRMQNAEFNHGWTQRGQAAAKRNAKETRNTRNTRKLDFCIRAGNLRRPRELRGPVVRMRRTGGNRDNGEWNFFSGFSVASCENQVLFARISA